ncbi:uncharacterized protein LOC143879214 isoform X1 [Tasmannia lanceolata]|uniref:uncharacterized protein LOC143879214 isoform X1 n=1 Tax=Tasmannia lanceolata TaxID=3420 RepID=UPI004063E530
MRLDTEPKCCHSSLVVESASKVLEYDYDPVEPGLLKADYMVGREGKCEIASELDNENYEAVVDLLPTEKLYEDGHWDALENENYGVVVDLLPTEKLNKDGHGDAPLPHSYMETGDSICGTTSEGGGKVTSYSNPATEFELSEKEMNFYTDKNVMELELPELIVCFKERNYHVIKDICIDEGVPSLDKTLVENVVDHTEKFRGFPQSDLDENRTLTKEVLDCALPISDGLKLLNFEEHHISDDDNAGHSSSPDRLLEEGAGDVDATEETVNGMSEETVVLDELHLVQDSAMSNWHADSSSSDEDENHQSDQAPNEKENLENLVGTSAEVSINSSNTEDFPIDSKVESGPFTSGFESSPPMMSDREESIENAEWQQSRGNLILSELDDWALDSLTGSTRSLFIQHGHGESSFAGMNSVSGPIAYSGPIPYSGSISLRSDSSTASTRSFAFPILHSEWNSSPVKMAKADRRHRGWRLALLCCRF